MQKKTVTFRLTRIYGLKQSNQLIHSQVGVFGERRVSVTNSKV